MEVHQHTHSPRKKWIHYFWEFFMLFLAVTLGFFVENQREHYVEHQREKQYIRSMIQDLREDTASFRKVVDVNIHANSRIDTLISLLKGEKRNQSARTIYYMARFIPFDDPYLVCQNKTFEQLKSSGGLRLIRNPAILNSISDYYQINRWIESGPTPMQFQNRRDLILNFDLLFDAAVFQQMIQPPDSLAPPIPDSHFVLLSDDLRVINTICTRYHIMYSAKKVVIASGKNFILQASSLITLLQKEYHIK